MPKRKGNTAGGMQAKPEGANETRSLFEKVMKRTEKIKRHTGSSLPRSLWACVCLALVAGGGLWTACGTGEGDEAGTDTPAGSMPFVQLANSGTQTVEVQSDEEACTVSFTVKRVGADASLALHAHMQPWSTADLNAYNHQHESAYYLLPEALYTVTPEEITLPSGEKEAAAAVRFNPSEVFEQVKESRAEYAIALRLASDEAKVSASQRDLFVGIRLRYPQVGFEAENLLAVNLTQEQVTVEIPTLFHSGIDGAEGAPWDFTCRLAVPENAAQLVAEYNAQNNTQYELLPAEAYAVGEPVAYRVGDTRAVAALSVNRSLLDIREYLLPVTLGEPSNEAVLCTSQVLYLSFNQLYNNPIMAESHADPTVIRADDGYFYMYSTENGGITDGMGIYRSADLVHWEWVGQVLHNKFPSWSVKSEYDLWAPEIRKVGDHYVIYYSVAKWGETQKCKIGVATGPTPVGPFNDCGAPVVTYEDSGVDNCIDPFYWEENGKKYLFWGSFHGIYVTELTDDALAVKRDAAGNAVFQQQVAGGAFEATCIYKKNGYYYLMASVGSCCEGANSTYRVVVGRSKDLFGPYVDKKGGRMLDNQYELVLQGNSTWVGPGHNSQIVTDDAGAEWMVYHSYSMADIDAGRMLMLDRLLWSEDGWPYIARKVPSDQAVLPTFYSRGE